MLAQFPSFSTKLFAINNLPKDSKIVLKCYVWQKAAQEFGLSKNECENKYILKKVLKLKDFIISYMQIQE